MSKKLENTLATHLSFQGESLQYFRNSQEIDFLLEDKIPLQVCYTLSEPTTFEREIRGLIKYLEFAGSKTGYIITWNESKTIKKGNKTINILPAWYFLLFGMHW